ncbi:uncharacterized protein LOC115284576, partial [Suricata suricatta]|uniref:uncharacterized protein LOC115284576 n=1 Tax=Suricata suricatta TaxID=37032 RepID=UPI0011559C03
TRRAWLRGRRVRSRRRGRGRLGLGGSGVGTAATVRWPLAARRRPRPLVRLVAENGRTLQSLHRAPEEPRRNRGPRLAPSCPLAAEAPEAAAARAPRDDLGLRDAGSGSAPLTRGRGEVAPDVVIRPGGRVLGATYQEAERAQAAGEAGGADGFAPLRTRVPGLSVGGGPRATASDTVIESSGQIQRPFAERPLCARRPWGARARAHPCDHCSPTAAPA